MQINYHSSFIWICVFFGVVWDFLIFIELIGILLWFWLASGPRNSLFLISIFKLIFSLIKYDIKNDVSIKNQIFKLFDVRDLIFEWSPNFIIHADLIFRNVIKIIKIASFITLETRQVIDGGLFKYDLPFLVQSTNLYPSRI